MKIKKAVEELNSIDKSIHLCILATNGYENKNEQEFFLSLISELRNINRNHVSFIEGGFEVLFNKKGLNKISNRH